MKKASQKNGNIHKRIGNTLKYYEILYENCFKKKYVALKCVKSVDDVKHNFPTFNGCRLIDIKETTHKNYRINKIVHFTDYSFSVK